MYGHVFISWWGPHIPTWMGIFASFGLLTFFPLGIYSKIKTAGLIRKLLLFTQIKIIIYYEIIIILINIWAIVCVCVCMG